jgi:hypothetical protein
MILFSPEIIGRRFARFHCVSKLLFSAGKCGVFQKILRTISAHCVLFGCFSRRFSRHLVDVMARSLRMTDSCIELTVCFLFSRYGHVREHLKTCPSLEAKNLIMFKLERQSRQVKLFKFKVD